MTRKLVGGIAAAAFALGIFSGAAATAVARDDTNETNCTAAMAGHMDGQAMAGMMSMMGGSMIGGSDGSMMGGQMGSPDTSMGPEMLGPEASAMPGGQHELHHASPKPGGSK